MALAGPSPSAADREEFLRMTTEKLYAFHESWNAMFLAMYRANLRFFLPGPAWSTFWLRQGGRVGSTKMRRVALDIVATGIAPIHRRAVSNAKRLRK